MKFAKDQDLDFNVFNVSNNERTVDVFLSWEVGGR